MKMPEPYRKQGQQLSADGYTVCHCDLYSAEQMHEAVNSAAQICQNWIDDHNQYYPADEQCTYNDCDMVAAVTDVMNQIKGIMK